MRISSCAIFCAGAPSSPISSCSRPTRKPWTPSRNLRVFWNQHYANAIRAAGQAGAKVIALDLAFGVPIDQWEPGADELLAGVISTSPVPVVVRLRLRAQYQSRNRRRIPINMMSAALGLSAFANLTSDADDFIRRPGTAGSSIHQSRRPSFRPLAGHAHRREIRSDGRRNSENGALTFQGHAIPVSPKPRHCDQLSRGLRTLSPAFPWPISRRRPKPEISINCGNGWKAKSCWWVPISWTTGSIRRSTRS